MRNLRSANLNLLPILRVLLRYKHVTLAARALNMSQSSVSEALGKLRHLFNDELLVQHRNHLIPTSLAQRLEPQIERMLESVAKLGPDLLTSAPSKSAIDISASDYLVLTVGTKVAGRMRTERPEIALRFLEHDQHSEGRLRSGDLDFMITPEITLGSSAQQFRRELLYEDRIVCLVASESNIVDRCSEEQYWTARHVFFSPPDDRYGTSRSTILQQVGEKRADATLVHSYLLLPFFIEGSGSIALVQNELAERLAPTARVRIVEAPFDIKVRFFLVWDEVRKSDPLHVWFVDLIRDTFRANAAVG